MTDAVVLEVLQRALFLAATICAPVLGFGLVVGLIVSIFQAATQIHEMSLTFIPKIIAVGTALAIFGPWIVRQVVGYAESLLTSIPSMIK